MQLPLSRQRAISFIVFGALLAIPSSWYLFVRLDVLHVPGLIRYFPQAYALLTALVITGLLGIVVGAVSLVRRPQGTPSSRT